MIKCQYCRFTNAVYGERGQSFALIFLFFSERAYARKGESNFLQMVGDVYTNKLYNTRTYRSRCGTRLINDRYHYNNEQPLLNHIPLSFPCPPQRADQDDDTSSRPRCTRVEQIAFFPYTYAEPRRQEQIFHDTRRKSKMLARPMITHGRWTLQVPDSITAILI